MSDFKYDINTKYDPNKNYSIPDLCDQIKLYKTDKKSSDSKNLYDYFNSSKKSSLLSKLKTHLDFDIKSICNNDKKEVFDMLKILYLLYDIEKNGYPRYQQEKNLNNRKVLITNILANHSFENVKTVFSNRSVFGDIFNDLYDKIQNQIDDAENRIEIYEQINFEWHKLAHIYWEKYVVKYDAVFHQESTLKEIDEIHNYFKEEILNKLQTALPLTLSYKEGVMKSFFNILNSHELMCYNFEKIRINRLPIPDKKLPVQYIDYNRENTQKFLEWDIVDYMKKISKMLLILFLQ